MSFSIVPCEELDLVSRSERDSQHCEASRSARPRRRSKIPAGAPIEKDTLVVSFSIVPCEELDLVSRSERDSQHCEASRSARPRRRSKIPAGAGTLIFIYDTPKVSFLFSFLFPKPFVNNCGEYGQVYISTREDGDGALILQG